MEPEPKLPYKDKFIYAFSFVGTTFTSLFGVLPNLFEGNYAYALFELTLVVMAILNLVWFHKKRDYRLASNIILFLVIVVLLFLVLTGGYRGTGILWIHVFPLLSFFMKGFWTALFWNVLFIGGILLSLLLSHIELLSTYYEPFVIRQALGSYLAVVFLSCFYSYIVGRLTGNLHKRAVRDTLTGLYNRGFIFETLTKLMDIVERDPYRNYCIAYLDIDNFKQVNDGFGHEVGDRVLIEFAHILTAGFRKGDIIGRIGGDEFLVIVYSCDPERLRDRLEGIRKDMEDRFSTYRLSLSYGIVEVPKDGLKVSDLISLADRRMYEMKRKKKG